MSTFVDTSGFYAIFDRRDPAHERARQTWARLADQDKTILSTNDVVIETVALLQHRYGHALARRFVHDVVPLLQIIWLDASLYAADAIWLGAGRRHLSLVDCASFATMRQHGLTDVLAFDPDFAEQGFVVLP